MATGCFVSTGRSLSDAIERVKLAESLGYETAYVTHVAGRESLTVVTAYALATSSIRVGPGVVPIYTRTPATMAQTAATIDELSDGRLNLGIGVSHRPVVEGWHGQTIDKPVAEMRRSHMTPRSEPRWGYFWENQLFLTANCGNGVVVKHGGEIPQTGTTPPNELAAAGRRTFTAAQKPV